MTSLIVVNLHGLINTPSGPRKTLIELGIGKTVRGDGGPRTTRRPWARSSSARSTSPGAPSTADLLASLLKARGKVSNAKPLDGEALKALGVKDHSELASKMIKDGSRLSSLQGVKPFFGLSPPKGGFKRSSRRQFRQGGVLGENPKLPDIVRRML